MNKLDNPPYKYGEEGRFYSIAEKSRQVHRDILWTNDRQTEVDGVLRDRIGLEEDINGTFKSQATNYAPNAESVNEALGKIDKGLSEEVARAKSEEKRIEDKLDDEITRATEAEKALDEKINDEIARAENAETNLDARINEVRADLISRIQTEANKRVEKDNELDTNIASLQTALDEAKNTITDMQTKIDSLESRVASLESQLAQN